MEVIAIISIFLTGILLGVVALDFGTRKRLQSELRTTLEKIQQVHNDQVSQIVDLQDKVNSHEMRLSGFKK